MNFRKANRMAFFSATVNLKQNEIFIELNHQPQLLIFELIPRSEDFFQVDK